MRFRRTRRRSRRPGANMIPMSICSNAFNAPGNQACSNGFADMFLLDGLHGMEFPTGGTLSTVEQLAAQTERKSLMVQGMRFHWGVFQVGIPAGALNAQYYLAVRAAIIRAPVAPTLAPQNFVNLFSKFDDVVGDVLWRGAGLLPGMNELACAEDVCALSYAGGGNNFHVAGTMGSPGRLPVQVKSKRRLDKLHALFFCVQVHNPLGAGSDIAMGLELFGTAAVRSTQLR